MPSTLRFFREYFRPDPLGVVAEETTYERNGEVLPATVFRPARRRGACPGWVVLHGLTYTGREHPALIRFVRAIAAAGNVVLVPDIPEWRALRVAPAVTVDTIRASVAALQARNDIEHEHACLFGFSFGATQALVASVDPAVRQRLHGIAAWGGYSNVHRLFLFGLLGDYDLDRQHYNVRPDPYGCWIMAGNYLTHVPGFEDYGDVERAVHWLALEAGRRRVFAWDPVFDPDKRRLRELLAPAHREVFDILAPETNRPGPDRAVGVPLSNQLADAAMRVDPLFDPTPFLSRVDVPVLLAHGRHDRLIPYTETIRLARALPSRSVESLTITALFEHSGGAAAGLGPLGVLREGARFVDVLRRVVSLPVR
jgi:pimeloyl-ACP methyl ester carboxylesterase